MLEKELERVKELLDWAGGLPTKDEYQMPERDRRALVAGSLMIARANGVSGDLAEAVNMSLEIAYLRGERAAKLQALQEAEVISEGS